MKFSTAVPSFAKVMAKMVREFEKLHYLDMTKTDDADATSAETFYRGSSKQMAIGSITNAMANH